MRELYDLIILGAGPAGLTAGLYAGRAGLSALIIEKGAEGGQLVLTNGIENYPGQLPDDSGTDLVARMSEQARKSGTERVLDEIQQVNLTGAVKTLSGQQGVYRARTVILAAGASHRPIGCRNEADYIGCGISFCAVCDAPFFEGLHVYVVGGGNAAVEEALYLTRFARQVTLLHRRDQLRAAKSIQERAFANPKLDFLWDTVVEEVGGDGVLSSMILKNVKTGERTKITAEPMDGQFGLFGFLGMVPNTALFQGTIELQEGYIVTDEDMRTNLSGVFAAGDIRRKSLRQAVTAAADGAIAAVQAEQYLTALLSAKEEPS